MRLHHINGGWLHKPPGPKASCHCVLIEDPAGLAVVDTGIGLEDVRDPVGRVGAMAIEGAGFQFREEDTVVRQVERLGFRADDVRHVILTHADPDHAGGLADFPLAEVHLSAEELARVQAGEGRYSAAQFGHGPRWRPHGVSGVTWFGLPAVPLGLGLASEVFLVGLPGHTLGHCGVAVPQGSGWALHVGDAYYLRVELTSDDHPVSRLTEARAADNALRRESLEHLRRLARDHAGEVEMFGYHDVAELPAA